MLPYAPQHTLHLPPILPLCFLTAICHFYGPTKTTANPSLAPEAMVGFRLRFHTIPASKIRSPHLYRLSFPLKKIERESRRAPHHMAHLPLLCPTGIMLQGQARLWGSWWDAVPLDGEKWLSARRREYSPEHLFFCKPQYAISCGNGYCGKRSRRTLIKS